METCQLDSTIKEMYERLSKFLLRQLDIEKMPIILEAGCGGGQLTIPFLKGIKSKVFLIAFDSWVDPYVESLNALKDAVVNEELGDRIGAVKGDVRQMGIRDESVDLIISNELFCDLDRQGSELALREFYRVLKKGGQMIHAELDPVPVNEAQELLVKADLEYCLESLPFEGERWFSPTIEELSAMIDKAGFRNVQVSYFRTDLKLKFEAAVEYLRRCNIDMTFVEEYEMSLRKHGIEFPSEHMVKCRKFSS